MPSVMYSTADIHCMDFPVMETTIKVWFGFSIVLQEHPIGSSHFVKAKGPCVVTPKKGTRG